VIFEPQAGGEMPAQSDVPFMDQSQQTFTPPMLLVNRWAMYTGTAVTTISVVVARDLRGTVVSYPPAEIRWVGLQLHWLIWLLLLSMISALLLKSRLKVSF
jgi:hypothetical protein